MSLHNFYFFRLSYSDRRYEEDTINSSVVFILFDTYICMILSDLLFYFMIFIFYLTP